MNCRHELVELNVLFKIKHGNKFDLNKMQECSASDEDSVVFIGRSGERNGIVGFVRLYENVEPHQSGMITVALGGAALSTFVQPKRFYTAQNIDVLEPRYEMTLDVKLYYCQCIEANRFRYSTFGREANRTLKRLLIPSIEGVPGWVKGAVSQAVTELGKDLNAVIQAS
jgi:hypothetical protein